MASLIFDISIISYVRFIGQWSYGTTMEAARIGQKTAGSEQKIVFVLSLPVFAIDGLEMPFFRSSVNGPSYNDVV